MELRPTFSVKLEPQRATPSVKGWMRTVSAHQNKKLVFSFELWMKKVFLGIHNHRHTLTQV